MAVDARWKAGNRVYGLPPFEDNEALPSRCDSARPLSFRNTDPEPGIMELWCSRENRFEDFGKGIIPIAQVPCIGPDCEEWVDGPVRFCIHLARVDKGRRL